MSTMVVPVGTGVPRGGQRRSDAKATDHDRTADVVRPDDQPTAITVPEAGKTGQSSATGDVAPGDQPTAITVPEGANQSGASARNDEAATEEGAAIPLEDDSQRTQVIIVQPSHQQPSSDEPTQVQPPR
jgi:hypothetical protein